MRFSSLPSLRENRRLAVTNRKHQTGGLKKEAKLDSMTTLNGYIILQILVKVEKEMEKKRKRKRGVHRDSKMYVVVGFQFDIICYEHKKEDAHLSI